MTTTTAANEHRVVSRDEWLKERIALLKEEKRITREQDAIAEKVRELPWVTVDQDYTFDSPPAKSRSL